VCVCVRACVCVCVRVCVCVCVCVCVSGTNYITYMVDVAHKAGDSLLIVLVIGENFEQLFYHAAQRKEEDGDRNYSFHLEREVFLDRGGPPFPGLSYSLWNRHRHADGI